MTTNPTTVEDFISEVNAYFGIDANEDADYTNLFDLGGIDVSKPVFEQLDLLFDSDYDSNEDTGNWEDESLPDFDDPFDINSVDESLDDEASMPQQLLHCKKWHKNMYPL